MRFRRLMILGVLSDAAALASPDDVGDNETRLKAGDEGAQS